MVILEENFKWHLEAFASDLFIYLRFRILSSDFIRWESELGHQDGSQLEIQLDL